MNKKQKRRLFEIICGAVLLVATFILSKIFPLDFPYSLLVYLPAYAISGYDVIAGAVTGIAGGEIFGEDTLMAIASIGALAIGEYPEAIFVMLFYKVGSLFESIAVGKSRKSIKALTSMKPTTATVIRRGEECECAISDVACGDTVVVRPGERIPVDGVIISGVSTLDNSALTGEALPQSVREGDRILSGAINKSGLLKIRVDTAFEESTVSKIVELVENSSSTKAKSEKFITKFSRYYTPSVIAAALVIGVAGSLITHDVASWVRRSLIFLVVSCPCALVISVPLSYFAGIGNAAKRGILIKGSDHLETLAKADKFVFDKTGTVTEGKFSVTAVRPSNGLDPLRLGAIAESASRHPLAEGIVTEYKKRKGAPPPSPEEPDERAGIGVVCRFDGKTLAAGGEKLMKSLGAAFDECHGTCVHVAYGGVYAGYVELADIPKKNSKRAVEEIREAGGESYMLSGDKAESAEKVASEVGIENVVSELLPAEKTEQLKKIAASSDGKLVFTGDGINDAPSIAASDVGIAMGALGSDIAIECADVVLLDDDPLKVAQVYRLSKRVRRTVVANIVFALAVKAAVLILGALGLANMWEAALADVGVSVIAILNSMRLLK